MSERMWNRGPKEKPAVSEVAVPPRQPLADLEWYGVAALCLGVAFAAALILDRSRFGEAAIPLLALGCAIASWYGGRGAALAAVVLSSLAFAYFFLEPRGHWSLRPSEVPSFITFVLFAAVVSWLGAVRRRAEADQKRAAESLRRTAAYVADAQKLARIGVWAADRNSKPIYWSEEVYRIFGFDPEHGLPTREQALERIHPEDHDKFRHATVTQKGHSDGEYRIVLPDGTIKFVHGSAHPVLDPNGEIVEVVGVIVDISERKRAEEALKESEANLNRAQEIAHVGSWHLDIARDRLVWSDEVFRIFDKPLGTSLTYEDFLVMVHPGDRERVDRAWTAALRGAPYDIEHRILAGTKLKWVRERAALDFDTEGNAVKGIGTVQDITERKRVEESLRQSEAYLAEAQRLSHTGSWGFDLASEKYVYLSEECRRIFGIDAQNGLPTREEIRRKIHPDDWDAVQEDYDRLLRERVDAVSEFRIVLPGGARHIQVIRHPVLNDAGDVVRIVGTAIDITDRKSAEEERERLRQLEADLRHLNRVSMMGELAASVAHEVNQPLAGIVSNASACLRWLAGDEFDVKEVREAIRDIVRDGTRAGEIITRIRALATKRPALRKEELDLNETIKEVLALAGDEAKNRSVTVQARFADDLPPVRGDRVQLQQVALNLIMNAIEAMSGITERPRGLVITTRNIDSAQVQVTVEDSGTGLDPNTKDKIFKSFYTTKPSGMGMGLSISSSIIEGHGGRLWAGCKDGPGAMFHFTLPK